MVDAKTFSVGDKVKHTTVGIIRQIDRCGNCQVEFPEGVFWKHPDSIEWAEKNRRNKMTDRPKEARRISSDPYEGEVMSIHKEDDGTFYVEIPELEWNEWGHYTARGAAVAGLERAEKAIRGTAGSGENTRIVMNKVEEILEIKVSIMEAKAKVEKLQDSLIEREKELMEAQNPRSIAISEGLRELPEDKRRVMHAATLLDSPGNIKPKAVGFRLHKDVDRDGDMDHAFILWSGHKKLVT